MLGLKLDSVCKSFGDLRLLDSISLELAEGELLVLLGRSGCGKSTLLRIIAGLEEADSGEIHIAGRRVDQLRPRDRDAAMVFQNYSLYPHMTVQKNLSFPLRVTGVGRQEIKERVTKIAELLDLADRLADRPGQLSGGQRQRVALGRAIIRDPAIFLLDEPLSNLDADLRVRMRQEIVALQKRLNRTMVHVTHDQSEALTMADRIALLHDGIIQQLGTPRELYEQPSNKFVAEFVGTPAINMIAAQLIDHQLIPFGLGLPKEVTDQLGSSAQLFIGIRPEAIEVSGDGEYSGVLTSSEYLGDHQVATIRFQNHEMTASKVPAPLPPAGQNIRFSINSTALHYFDSETGCRLECVK